MDKNIIIKVVGGIAALVLMVWGVSSLNGPGKLDGFAQCVKDSGTTFFGAFWCPHCQNQKALFGKSAKLLPYVECSTADGKGQTQACIDKGIESYPTWEFPGGERMSRELSLQDLAEKTSCELPK
jgi:hypothetical protein